MSKSLSIKSLKLKLLDKINPLIVSKSKLNVALDIITYVLFLALFFSLPALSFTPGLNMVTWALTIAFLFFAVLSCFLYYDFKINFIVCSFILFIVFYYISSLLNGFVYVPTSPVLLMIFTIITYMYCLANKSSRHTLFYCAYGGLAIFLMMFCILYRTALIHFDFARLGAEFGDENDIANFFGLGYVLSLYLFIFKGKYSKIFFAITTLLFFYCGVSCGSKIFIVSFGVITIFLIFARAGKKHWYKALIITILVVGAFIGLLQLPFMATIKNRLVSFIATLFGQSGSGTTRDGSTYDRMSMFLCGMNMFLKKPMFGYGGEGFGNFAAINNAWSHNHFSEMLCNFGIVGTFFFELPYIYAIIKFIKNRKKVNNLLPFALALFFFTIMFGVCIAYQKISAYMLGIIISCAEEPTELANISFRRLFTKKNNKLKVAE